MLKTLSKPVGVNKMRGRCSEIKLALIMARNYEEYKQFYNEWASGKTDLMPSDDLHKTLCEITKQAEENGEDVAVYYSDIIDMFKKGWTPYND